MFLSKEEKKRRGRERKGFDFEVFFSDFGFFFYPSRLHYLAENEERFAMIFRSESMRIIV